MARSSSVGMEAAKVPGVFGPSLCLIWEKSFLRVRRLARRAAANHAVFTDCLARPIENRINFRVIPRPDLLSSAFSSSAEGVERLASRGEVRADRIAAELLIGFRLAAHVARARLRQHLGLCCDCAADSVRLSARSRACARGPVSPSSLWRWPDVVRQLGVERFLEREVGVLFGHLAFASVCWPSAPVLLLPWAGLLRLGATCLGRMRAL